MEIHDQEYIYNSSTGCSSSHFNSFLGLVTSDEEDDDAADNDQLDTYIEIALEPSPPSTPPQLQDQLNDHEEELQLRRISFSSRVFPFPGQISSLCTSDGVHGPDDHQAISCDNLYTPKLRFRAAMNRLLSIFPSTFNICTTRSWELLLGSRGETSAAPRRSGVVANFLVKLRATTFQMMMASLLKLRQCTTSSSPEKMSRRDVHQLEPRKAQMLIVKPLKKFIRNIPRDQSRKIERSKVADRVTFSMKRAVSSRNGRLMKTKSCPASVRSSPSKCKEHFTYEIEGGGSSSWSHDIHFARDNSVQAAIAHCKKSLGGADDFHF